MRGSMEQQLADFLRKRRGEETYASFARRTGLRQSTIFRLEQCQQSLTLGRLEQLLKRLKVKLSDIFPGK